MIYDILMIFADFCWDFGWFFAIRIPEPFHPADQNETDPDPQHWLKLISYFPSNRGGGGILYTPAKWINWFMKAQLWWICYVDMTRNGGRKRATRNRINSDFNCPNTFKPSLTFFFSRMSPTLPTNGGRKNFK